MEHQFQFFNDQPNELDNSLEEESEDEGEGSGDGERTLKVRLDKWLWAARFFKTRALARAAVEAGKVFYNGERSKPSREIEVEAVLQIRQGRLKTVIVKGLSTRRRSTEEALQLFEETEESKASGEFHREFHENNWSQQSHQTAIRNPFTLQEPQRRTTRFLRRSFNRQQNPGMIENGRPQGREDHSHSEFVAPQYARPEQRNEYSQGSHRGHGHYADQHRSDYPQARYPRAEHRSEQHRSEHHRSDYSRSEYPQGYSNRNDHSRNDYHNNYQGHQGRSNHSRSEYPQAYSHRNDQSRNDYPNTYNRSEYSRSNYPASGPYRQNNSRHDSQHSQRSEFAQSYQARSQEYNRSDYSRNERYDAQHYNSYPRQNQHYSGSRHPNQRMTDFPNNKAPDFDRSENED